MTAVTVWLAFSLTFVFAVALHSRVRRLIRKRLVQRRVSDLELWRQKRDAWAVRDGDGITPIRRGR